MNMNDAPSPNQTLLLWRIVAFGATGEIMQKDLGVAVNAADRQQLVGLGLLEVEKATRGSLKLTVTDRGWGWVRENLGAELPEKASAKVAPLLQRWLTLLHGYLERQRGSIADLFQPAGQEVSRDRASEIKTNGAQESVHARVRREYLALTRGEIKTRCLLRDLRQRLPDVPRASLDVTIGNMVTSGEAVLFRLDNRLEITPADIHAAIQAGGEQQHILWLDR
jgi:hypothetical protein